MKNKKVALALILLIGLVSALQDNEVSTTAGALLLNSTTGIILTASGTSFNSPLIYQGSRTLNATIDARTLLFLLKTDANTRFNLYLNRSMEALKPSIDGSNVTSGTVSVDRIPTTVSRVADVNARFNVYLNRSMEAVERSIQMENITDLPTCSAGEYTTSDGTVFTCDTPAGGNVPALATTGVANITVGGSTNVNIGTSLDMVARNSNVSSVYAITSVNTPLIKPVSGLSINSGQVGNSILIENCSGIWNRNMTCVSMSNPSGSINRHDLQFNLPAGDSFNVVQDTGTPSTMAFAIIPDKTRNSIRFSYSMSLIGNKTTLYAKGLGADIHFDPDGNNVNPGTDNADSLGQSGTRWATLWSAALNTGDVCTTIGCWTESINSYNESDMCWTYEQLSKEMRDLIVLWDFRNNYSAYKEVTDEPFTEDVFNQILEKITDNGRPDFALGRKITYCFNEIGYNQAATELILEQLKISKEDVKAKQTQLSKEVKDVGELKEKKGNNVVKTTSTFLSTSTLQQPTTTTQWISDEGGVGETTKAVGGTLIV